MNKVNGNVTLREIEKTVLSSPHHPVFGLSSSSCSLKSNGDLKHISSGNEKWEDRRLCLCLVVDVIHRG